MIKKPALFWYLTEGIRATFELLRCLVFMAFYRYPNPPKSDGRPVMVIPGFLGNDLSTRLLRKFIGKLGYTVYGWELGTNLGNLNDLKTLSARVKSLQTQHGEKISLIGWSLGGIYARELAKENPQAVRRIITLGSPFSDLEAPNHARWIFDLINKGEQLDAQWSAKIPLPAPVPTTAIYSKQDGIVPWAACMEQMPDAAHQNIEVRGSHFGLPANIAVFQIVKTRLGQN
jgi:pimeloyl-ACP methyl ester carboxylesterase